MARVSIENLTKLFPGRSGEAIRAVAGASFCLEEKELLVLVGPSGCGKTTLLRLIAGLETPDSGTIAIDGKVINDVPPKDRDVAMVFQNYALYPHMSAFQNLTFGLRLRKCAPTEIRERVRETADLLGLNGCLDRQPNALSGGQRQRVALGRALVRRPGLLLLDEPLSSLDAPLRGQMREEIARLHSRLGLTMLYVTHDQMEAMTLGSRIAVMNLGKLQQVATPMELYQIPINRFVAGFFGSPTMNFFNGTAIENGSSIAFQEQSAPASLPAAKPMGPPFRLRIPPDATGAIRGYMGKDVVLGIRPEHITAAQYQGSVDQFVKAVVERVVPLGAETQVRCSSGAHSFTARLPATDPVTMDGMVAFEFDMRHAHFFDPATERRIGV